jgi:hypothetical protein
MVKPEGHWSRGPLGPELNRLRKAFMDRRWSGEQLRLFDPATLQRPLTLRLSRQGRETEPLSSLKNKDQTRAREGVRSC